MRIGKITQTAWQRYVRKQLHTETDDAMSGASPWESCSFLENGCLRADAHASGMTDGQDIMPYTMRRGNLPPAMCSPGACR